MEPFPPLVWPENDPGTRAGRYPGKFYLRDDAYARGVVNVWSESGWRCEHGIQQSLCHDCGGSGYCEHSIRRTKCKECGPSQKCQHGFIRKTCPTCKSEKSVLHGQTMPPPGSSPFCEARAPEDGQ